MAIDLDKVPESNIEWCAQQLAMGLAGKGWDDGTLGLFKKMLEQSDELLYKSWAKDMPLKEFFEAVKLIDRLQ